MKLREVFQGSLDERFVFFGTFFFYPLLALSKLCMASVGLIGVVCTVKKN